MLRAIIGEFAAMVMEPLGVAHKRNFVRARILPSLKRGVLILDPVVPHIQHLHKLKEGQQPRKLIQ